jgi:hypothetical protein
LATARMPATSVYCDKMAERAALIALLLLAIASALGGDVMTMRYGYASLTRISNLPEIRFNQMALPGTGGARATTW